MANLYICILTIARVIQQLFDKLSSNETSGFPMFVKYCAYRQLFSAGLGLLMILAAGSGFEFNTTAVMIAFVSGMALFLNFMWTQIAMKSGTIALTALFAMGGILIPCFGGIFLFHEPMSVAQWLGVALLVVSAYLLICSSGKIYSQFTSKTFFLLIGIMISNGTVMLMQQMYAHYLPDGNVSVFSFLSFGTAGLALLLLSLVPKRKESDVRPSRLSRKLWLYGAVLAVLVFVSNQLSTLASVMVPPAVLFGLTGGGSTVLVTIIAAVWFKERITKESVAGVVLGIASLLIIKMM